MSSESVVERGAAARLWQSHDLTALGTLANEARERVSGAKAYYRRAAAVSPRDWEGASAALAGAEIRLTGAEGLSLAELGRIAGRAQSLGARLRMLTWRELEQLAERERASPDALLGALARAGLRLLAGGELIEDGSVGRRAWLEAAQRAGIRAELVWTVRRGETAERVAAELEALRSAAAAYPIFDCIVPRVAGAPAVESDAPTGYNRLRAIALARLTVDAVPRVRGSAAELGESLMQVAQWYGADDAGDAATAPECERLAALLRETGREPIEDRR